MTSPGNTKPYHEPYSDKQDVPQPNVFERDGDVLPQDVSESYEISEAERVRNQKNDASERDAQIELLMAEAEAAAEASQPAPTARDEALDTMRPTFIAAATRMFDETYAELRDAYNAGDVYEVQRLRLKIKEPLDRLARLGVTPDDPDNLLR